MTLPSAAESTSSHSCERNSPCLQEALRVSKCKAWAGTLGQGDKKPSCTWPYWLWDMTKLRGRGRTKGLPLDKRMAGLSLDPAQTAMSVLFPEKPRSFRELMSWAGKDLWVTTPGSTAVCQSPWGQRADNSHKGTTALRILSFQDKKTSSTWKTKFSNSWFHRRIEGGLEDQMGMISQKTQEHYKVIKITRKETGKKILKT